jgi:surface polysaccharide O-acyltransferase-like enzyme
VQDKPQSAIDKAISLLFGEDFEQIIVGIDPHLSFLGLVNYGSGSAILVIILLPVLSVSYMYSGDPARFAGGLYWQAFTYALWEQFLGVSIIIALSVLFREKYNHQGRLTKAMSESTYTVYIFHAPIIVFLALGLRGIILSLLPKFVLVTPLAVFLCFLLSNYIRKLPIARRIL